MTSRTYNPSRRVTLLLLVLVTAASLLTLSSTPVQASDGSIDFDGAGWGHGVGMSQYGAYGRAQSGQDYLNILEDYYTGSKVRTFGAGVVSDPGDVVVNVGSDMTSTTLTVDEYAGGSAGLTIVRETGDAEPPSVVLGDGDRAVVTDTTPLEGNPGGCEVTITIDGSTTVWPLGTCDLTVGLASGAASPSHLISATNCRRLSDCTYGWGTSFKLVDNGSSQRTLKDVVGGCTIGCPEYPGFDIVVTLSLDDYTRGIAEVPFSWPVEALKTQAVAARSFAATYVVDTNHKKAGCFCDVKNDSSYQVYAGWIGDRSLWGRWDQAAKATTGKVVSHAASPYDDIVRAYYSSSNGGASEWVKEKWGGDYPFLVSVDDPWSLVSANPRRSWTFTVSSDAVVDRVWGTSSTRALIDAEVIARNVSGSAKTVRFIGEASNGNLSSKDVSSKNVASWFGLYSWYFDIDAAGVGPVVFIDIASSVHEVDIQYLAERKIALACDAGPNLFCPNDRMRREDLAAFMVRALDLPATSKDYFADDNGLEYEDDINSLAAAGITLGCNPPANTKFCPDNTVTRGQTAAFIVRAWSLTNAGPGDWFSDDDASVFERDIDRLATAGITKGCNPPANTNYCPNRLLTRAEMSSFLARALRDLGVP